MRPFLFTFLILLFAWPVFPGPLADYNLNTYNSLILNGSRCTGMDWSRDFWSGGLGVKI